MNKLFTAIILWLHCALHSAVIYDNTNNVVYPFVGSAFSGYVDGQGDQTMFTSPNGICKIGTHIFTSDGNRIRKISSDAVVTTVAGGGLNSQGCGTNLALPSARIFSDGSAMHYHDVSSIIRIDSWTACKSTIGLTNSNGHLAFGSSGNVYFSSSEKIWRRLPSGTIELIAGSGNTGTNDGTGIFCSFNAPTFMVCDSAENIFVYDSGSYLMRKVTQSGVVTTVGGKNSFSTFGDDGSFGVSTFGSGIKGLAIGSDSSLYFTDVNRVRKLYQNGTIVTVAGSTSGGTVVGPYSEARFSNLRGLLVDESGDIYVCDSTRIRRISQDYFVDSPPANLSLASYPGLTISGIPGRNYRVESSTDSATWRTNSVFTLPTTPHLWFDTNSISGNRFYRAVLLP